MEDERKAKWGSLSDEAIKRLQAAGIDGIAGKWGGLSEPRIQQLKQAGFIGLLELSGLTTRGLEDTLGLNHQSSATADFCLKLDSVLGRLMKDLKVDLPGIIRPTHQARQ